MRVILACAAAFASPSAQPSVKTAISVRASVIHKPTENDAPLGLKFLNNASKSTAGERASSGKIVVISTNLDTQSPARFRVFKDGRNYVLEQSTLGSSWFTVNKGIKADASIKWVASYGWEVGVGANAVAISSLA